MKASDFMLGNFIKFSNKIQPDRVIQVRRRFFSSGLFQANADDFTIMPYYTGIILNHEWLVNLGFDNISQTNIYVKTMHKIGAEKLTSIAVYLDEVNYTIAIVDYYTGVEKTSLLHLEYFYVHQLQNVYHALTGLNLTFFPVLTSKQKS